MKTRTLSLIAGLMLGGALHINAMELMLAVQAASAVASHVRGSRGSHIEQHHKTQSTVAESLEGTLTSLPSQKAQPNNLTLHSAHILNDDTFLVVAGLPDSETNANQQVPWNLYRTTAKYFTNLPDLKLGDNFIPDAGSTALLIRFRTDETTAKLCYSNAMRIANLCLATGRTIDLQIKDIMPAPIKTRGGHLYTPPSTSSRTERNDADNDREAE